MVLAYMSLYGLFVLAPFVLRSRRELRALVLTLAALILGGGIGFLVVPAELAFPPPAEAALGRWAALYHFADRLNLTYDLVPSLHVAFAVACVAVFAPRAPRAGRVAVWAWGALIASATVLTHQHHVIDVVTGWLLALVCVRMVFLRALAPAP
jgi:membrane-associated phospholipid phosphatase